jgi:hypothetical protein
MDKTTPVKHTQNITSKTQTKQLSCNIDKTTPVKHRQNITSERQKILVQHIQIKIVQHRQNNTSETKTQQH